MTTSAIAAQLCGHCGSSIPPSRLFCPACGKPAVSTTPAAAAHVVNRGQVQCAAGILPGPYVPNRMAWSTLLLLGLFTFGLAPMAAGLQQARNVDTFAGGGYLRSVLFAGAIFAGVMTMLLLLGAMFTPFGGVLFFMSVLMLVVTTGLYAGYAWFMTRGLTDLAGVMGLGARPSIVLALPFGPLHFQHAISSMEAEAGRALLL